MTFSDVQDWRTTQPRVTGGPAMICCEWLRMADRASRLFRRVRRRAPRFTPRPDGLEDRALLNTLPYSPNIDVSYGIDVSCGDGNGQGNIGVGNGQGNGQGNIGVGNGNNNGNGNIGNNNGNGNIGNNNGNGNIGNNNGNVGNGNGNGNVSTVWVYSGPQKVHHSGHLHLWPLPFQPPVKPAR